MGRRTPIAGRVPAAEPDEDVVRRVVRGLLACILVLRWMVPTEGTAAGDTLWIAQLSLLLGLLWAWSLVRDESPRLRFGAFDAAVLALAGVHAVSSLSVWFRGDGDVRAALNVGWEWVALAVTYVVARNVIDTVALARRFVTLLAAMAIALAGLGVWQHYVWFPSLSAEYVSQRDEFDRIRSIDPARRTPAESRRMAEIQTSFDEQGVPLEGPRREAFENRLLGSREPLGRFALANTFAGWLLAGAFALAGLVGAAYVAGRRGPAVAVGVGLALVLFCLLLTKSRTAWVGLIAGAAGWAWTGWRRPGKDPSTEDESDATPGTTLSTYGPVIAAVLGLGVLVAVGGALLTGGLDREVLSQAPRSLRFRLQYWTGTLAVITERPVLGTGPGNFRQHYLAHKLAESSEEIADPHNLVLDVWANAGTGALLALLAVAVLGWWRWRAIALIGTASDDVETGTDEGLTVIVGAAVGFVVLLGRAFLSVEPVTDVLLLGPAVVSLLILWERANASGPAVVGLGWGVVAVGVHLLGAGGIAMPAIPLVLLPTVLCALAVGSEERDAGESRPLAGWSKSIPGCVLGVLFVGLLTSATLPVIESGALESRARAELVEGRIGRARELFEQSTLRDPLSSTRLDAAARFAFGEWESSERRDDAAIRRAIRLHEEAVERDPRSATRRAALGTTLESRFRATGDLADGERAADVLADAADRYPTNAALRSQRAILLADLGRREPAADEARIALRLDALNRAEGHRDRFLPANVRTRLEQLIPVENGRPSG